MLIEEFDSRGPPFHTPYFVFDAICERLAQVRLKRSLPARLERRKVADDIDKAFLNEVLSFLQVARVRRQTPARPSREHRKAFACQRVGRRCVTGFRTLDKIECVFDVALRGVSSAGLGSGVGTPGMHGFAEAPPMISESGEVTSEFHPFFKTSKTANLYTVAAARRSVQITACWRLVRIKRRPTVDDLQNIPCEPRCHQDVTNSTDEARDRFLAALPLAHAVITALARRTRLPDGDEENFRSLAIMKLVDNDYRVFRQFRGRSSLRTYLTVVLRRVLLDYQTECWGKWRPSVAARRRGRVAVRLERLLARDGFTFREAVTLLRTNFCIDDSTAELHDIAAALPNRSRVAVRSGDVLPDVADPAPMPDAVLAHEQSRAMTARVRAELRQALRHLPDADKLILKMRYVDDIPIVRIAQVLGCEPKPLYRRIERILSDVRKGLHARGVDAQMTRAVLEC